jgi:succinyl-CoA synthetase beta subunit
MNIHEYQAKQLFEKFGVASPKGIVASTAEEAGAAAREIGGAGLVVKAQVHAGGRGKGTFKNGFKGGVHLVNTPEEAQDIAGKMLGQTLVTHQTGPEGKLVSKVLIAKSVDITKEYYFAILFDRGTSGHAIIASTEGGMNIEEVAEKTPEKITKEFIHPTLGLQAYQCRKIAASLGLRGPQMNQAVKLFTALWNLYLKADCSLVEINPLAITTDGQVVALDAKFNFDDNALYRQKDVTAMRDTTEEDPAKSPRANSASTTSASTATSPASSTAPASPCPRWTSSSSTAANLPTSSTSAAARRRSRSPRPSRSSSAIRT